MFTFSGLTIEIIILSFQNTTVQNVEVSKMFLKKFIVFFFLAMTH